MPRHIPRPPSHAALIALGTWLLAMPLSPLAADWRVERDIAYGRADGQPLLADLYRPAASGPHPGVVMIHGGGWRTGNRGQMAPKAERLAAAGYVVLNVSYRLGPAYHFPAQVHDVKQAVRWLRSRHEALDVDPQRIAAFGYSAGAHLAMLLGLTTPTDGLEGAPIDAVSSRVQAVVAGGTPADLALFNDNRSTRALIGADKAERPDAYRAASPIHYVSADDPPVFLYHGRHDRIVPVVHAQRLARALQASGVEHELHIAPFGHIYRFLFDRRQVHAAIEFLDRHLRN